MLDVPHDLDGTADLLYTGRGSLIWLQDLDALGRRAAAPARARGTPRDLRGTSRPSGCSTRDEDGRLDAHRLRLLRAARRRPGAGRRPTSTASRSPTASSTGSSRGRGRWARSSPRWSGPGCVSTRSPSTRWTGGRATGTCVPRSAAGCRCPSRSRRRAAPDRPGDGAPRAAHRDSWPQRPRLGRSRTVTAVGAHGRRRDGRAWRAGFRRPHVGLVHPAHRDRGRDLVGGGTPAVGVHPMHEAGRLTRNV